MLQRIPAILHYKVERFTRPEFSLKAAEPANMLLFELLFLLVQKSLILLYLPAVQLHRVNILKTGTAESTTRISPTMKSSFSGTKCIRVVTSLILHSGQYAVEYTLHHLFRENVCMSRKSLDAAMAISL